MCEETCIYFLSYHAFIFIEAILSSCFEMERKRYDSDIQWDI